MIGQTLGQYRIVEKIGAGGMGEVHRARDERLQRDVALKVLPAGLLTDETARRRFCKEALALSKLNHPNIETVHEFDTQNGIDFLVMEYIAGVTLDERLAQGPVPEKEIARLGAQLADGLASAHGQGVVHRDLKPGNLRVTPEGRLKILDFGLARLLRPATDTATTESLTETQGVAGTLPYMAPEQLQGEKADARSDIWAAGAVLYEMATGHRPFPETQTPRLIDAILHQAPTPPSSVNRRVSPALESIILKCVDKEPDRRYQSAKELRVDLERLTAPVPVVAAPRRRKLVPRWALAAGSVVLLLAVLFGLNLADVRDRFLRRFGIGAGRINSLAVLPLENLSKDPSQDYFSDGLTEALIADLAKIGPLRVISRTSVMRYKGTKKTLPEIARELNVDAVVEASVLRAGERVRITAQLIEGATDRHLWAESYERDLRDILALQSEVSRAITKEIHLVLAPQQKARLASARPVNPAAHEAYLKGGYNCRRPEQVFQGVDFFKQAIALDPNYAPAHAGLALCLGGIGFGGLLPPREAFPQAKAAALKAIELDETLPEGHRALAFYSIHHEWDWSAAEKEYRRALDLNPNDGEVHHIFAHFLMVMGRGEEAVAETLRAFELDPANLVLSACRGWHCLYNRQFDQALAYLEETLKMAPNNFQALDWLGQVYEQMGKYEEALAAYEKAVSASGGRRGVTGLGRAYALTGKKREAELLLRDLLAKRKEKYVPPYDIAAIYVALGRREEAFAWLDRAFEERSPMVVHVNWDPRFDNLRDHPRMADLIRRIGLPAIRPASVRTAKNAAPSQRGG